MSDSREHMLNLIHNAVRMGAAAQPPYDASAAPGSVNGTGPQQAPAAADATTRSHGRSWSICSSSDCATTGPR